MESGARRCRVTAPGAVNPRFRPRYRCTARRYTAMPLSYLAPPTRMCFDTGSVSGFGAARASATRKSRGGARRGEYRAYLDFTSADIVANGGPTNNGARDETGTNWPRSTRIAAVAQIHHGVSFSERRPRE